jgi:hypothetical protein
MMVVTRKEVRRVEQGHREVLQSALHHPADVVDVDGLAGKNSLLGDFCLRVQSKLRRHSPLSLRQGMKHRFGTTALLGA